MTPIWALLRPRHPRQGCRCARRRASPPRRTQSPGGMRIGAAAAAAPRIPQRAQCPSNHLIELRSNRSVRHSLPLFGDSSHSASFGSGNRWAQKGPPAGTVKSTQKTLPQFVIWRGKNRLDFPTLRVARCVELASEGRNIMSCRPHHRFRAPPAQCASDRGRVLAPNAASGRKPWALMKNLSSRAHPQHSRRAIGAVTNHGQQRDLNS